MLLEVCPIQILEGCVNVPASKPETQRAIITASLSPKKTRILNPLYCSEVMMMRDACEAIGVTFKEEGELLEVTGIDIRKSDAPQLMINSSGSGLVFRIFTALSSFMSKPSVVTGDSILCRRVMADLFEGLRTLGADIQSICEPGKGPIINWGKPLRGGHVTLPGNISSQFITAILIAAPLAEEPTSISVTGELLSQSYIVQTITAMRSAGIQIEVDKEFRNFKVYPGQYNAQDLAIKEDYTSASYLLVAAALLPGSLILNQVHLNSEQGEVYILEILRQMGIDSEYNPLTKQLRLNNRNPELEGHFHFDVSNCPNIVPTLAALGAYVKGTFQITGAAITRFHKASRVEAMTSELKKLGVNINPLYKAGYCDGFEIKGASTYEGGVTFDSWKDHRIFMSLFVASLRAKKPCYLEGYERVICSFPNFLKSFKDLGVKMAELGEDRKVVCAAKQPVQLAEIAV